MSHRVSVVIPTRDRPESLRRCLDAVLAQRAGVAFEVIVVNDRGVPVAYDDDRLTVLEGRGGGPAAARNLGLGRASGEIALFTDDDAVPQPSWMMAALAALEGTPGATGVAGRVVSPAFDPLYEHSVMAEDADNFLTCNVAYRRAALVEVGGFDPGFPYPAGEDRDLGYRVSRLGPVLYAPEMVVVHPPRPITWRQTARRGRFVRSEWRLHAAHPQTRPPRWASRWGPVVRIARHWQRIWREDPGVRASPRRAARWLVLAGGELGVAVATTLRDPSRADPLPESRASGLRVAWIGAEPSPGGGVAGVGWILLRELARRGCEIDCYAGGPHDELRDRMRALPAVRLVNFDSGWRSDRSYSRHRMTKFVTGFGKRTWERRQLGRLLVAQHRVRPYDVIYQFSTIESFGLPRDRRGLPPLVVHPEVHIAGELRWLRSERALATQCEEPWRVRLVEAFLAVRARRQRRDIAKAHRVAAISRVFGEQVAADYHVDRGRLHLVRNPVELNELQPPERLAGHGRLRVVFVGRMSVRKGVELVVGLSHRLDDLAGAVQIDVIGDHTLWSDYRPLLAGLNPSIARYLGPMERWTLISQLGRADLLIQPAKYEPFGLTVAEALAMGVPVVVTDAVGAGEDVSEECCLRVTHDDLDAFERGVREMVRRHQDGKAPRMRAVARAEAERLFAPDLSADAALALIEGVAVRETRRGGR